ncbi:MAG: UDP-glucose 4-epimerase [Paracidovorax wautersii]|uniref:UDP-glucose 4-epimerase n=1 Tax=Paracidovorax wautersii TaxID=1177982 RepID=A0A7V8FMA5_9BURK|nr:MAG: UDP-glucose 4-epimerase [Paracidovorax wautersii]
MQILVTGGAGYIGSHTVVELLQSGHEVVVFDNLCNSSDRVLARIEQITGRRPTLVVGDVRDRAALDAVFQAHAIDAVIHFAGLKAVGESVKKPLAYYENNVSGSVTLAQAMAAAGVFKLVFSSSATVYGPDAPVPYVETMPLGRASNPYGASKIMTEQILADLCLADERWQVALLRYFNPIGAHASGLIGEDPKGIPNNLLPFVTQVAVGQRAELSIFGGDYDTQDGTCVRDYLHVVDLARGHLKALEKLGDAPGARAYNLGTGQGVSVLQIVGTFEAVTGQKVPYRVVPRRAGDLAAFWADAAKAEAELGWRATHTLDDMMRDAWRWQSGNPQGLEPGL